MTDEERFKQYLIVDADSELLFLLRGGDGRSLTDFAIDILRSLGVTAEPSRLRIFSPTGEPMVTPAAGPTTRIVISYAFQNLKDISAMYENIASHLRNLGTGGLPPGSKRIVVNGGADPLGHAAYGMGPAHLTFGNRSMARRLVGAKALDRIERRGENVNVVIVDQGLNRAALESRNPPAWGGGFDLVDGWSIGQDFRATPVSKVRAGTAPRRSHGMMIARNVLDLAPNAKLWDVPILADQIVNPGLFASEANAVFGELLRAIRAWQAKSAERWVIVNSWAIYDRSTEWPTGDYSQNRRLMLSIGFTEAMRKQFEIAIGHPLITTVGELVDSGVDMVFSAGNCGQFTSSSRCGGLDRGPGRSIWGANAHPDVVTVGAVSAAVDWMGYSSEGPAIWIKGGEDRRIEKPDIVAPSHFVEDADASLLNSGTSAATGFVAGAIAALRSRTSPIRDMKPGDLRRLLVDKARPVGDGWNPRTGHGVLDLRSIC